MMPECRCRTDSTDYRQKCRCWTSFSPVFRHLYIIYDFSISYSKNNTISSCLWPWRVYRFPLPEVWTCTGYPSHHHHQQLFYNIGLSGIQSVRNSNEQKYRCRNQSGKNVKEFLRIWNLNVYSQVHHLLVSRFDRTGSHAVAFDDFIRCCLCPKL